MASAYTYLHMMYAIYIYIYIYYDSGTLYLLHLPWVKGQPSNLFISVEYCMYRMYNICCIC